MIRVFLLLLSTMAGFWYIAYVLEEKGPGYVWVSYNNYSIETTFWIFVGLIVAIVGVIYATIYAMKAIIYCLKHVGVLSKNWGVSKSEQSMVQFRLAYADGHWHKANEAFKKGVKKSALQPSDRVMAIRSALKLNKLSEAKAQLIELQNLGSVNELSMRLLELDIAMAEENHGLSITLFSQLLRDYPKEENLRVDAFHYFLTQGNHEKASATYAAFSRKQKIRYQLDYTAVELLQVTEAEDIHALKPLLKSIHKHVPILQLAVLNKAGQLDTVLAIKGLLLALKHQQYVVLESLPSFVLNENTALDLLKQIEAFLDQNITAGLDAKALAGLAWLMAKAKLNNKALGVYQQSLILEHCAKTFKQYVQLLKVSKSTEEMNAAIMYLSEHEAC